MRALRPVPALAAAVLALAGCGGPQGNAANGQAAGNAGAGQSAAPNDAIAATALAEFDRVCRDLSDIGALRAAAAAAGWAEHEPQSGEDVEKLLTLGEKTVRELVPGATYNNWAFRKAVSGRDLTLVLTDIPEGPAKTTECRLYDFAAPLPSAEGVRRWTGTAPTNSMNQDGLTAWEWSPGFRDNLTQISVLHLDRNSPVRQQIPAVGLAIAAVKTNAPID